MKNELNQYIKEAMLSKNEVELRVFRLIKNAFMEFEKAKNAGELTVDAEAKILIKMLKQREDSILQFTEAKRSDLVANEQDEIEVIKKFLPKEVTKEELESYVNWLFLEPKEGGWKMGDYIKAVKTKYPTADGKIVADLVRGNF